MPLDNLIVQAVMERLIQAAVLFPPPASLRRTLQELNMYSALQFLIPLQTVQDGVLLSQQGRVQTNLLGLFLLPIQMLQQMATLIPQMN